MNRLAIDASEARLTDASGHEIETIYHNVPGVYRIYLAGGVVRVEHADDPELAEKQRQVIAPILSLTSDVDILIQGWRQGNNSSFTPWRLAGDRAKAKANYFSWRIADSFALAMQWHPDTAEALLLKTKEDVLAERRAKARYYYLILAFGLAACGVAFGFYEMQWPKGQGKWSMVQMMTGAGALGAFFSVATGLKDRTIKIDLNYFENMLDAALRITIGLIAGLVSGWLVFSGILPLEVPDFTVEEWTAKTTMFLLVIGFLAGFLERLVPDLLAKTGSMVGGTAPVVTATGTTTASLTATRVASQARASAIVADTASGGTLATDGTDDTDTDLEGCAHGEARDLDDPAEDEELPEATGGVADSTPAGN